MFGCVCWLPLRAGFLLLIRRWGGSRGAALSVLQSTAPPAMHGRTGSCPAGSGAGVGLARSPAAVPVAPGGFSFCSGSFCSPALAGALRQSAAQGIGAALLATGKENLPFSK